MTVPAGRKSTGTKPFLIATIAAIGMFAAACGSQTETTTPSVASLPEPGESAASAEDNSSSGDADIDSDSNEEEVSEEDAEAASLRYDQCLADNGIDFSEMQDGGIIDLDSTGLDGAEFEAAMAECEEILEGVFGDFELSPEQEAEFADAEARFEKCMADQGFEIGGDSGGFQIDGDPEDIDDAFAECNNVFENIIGDVENESGDSE